MADTNSLLPAKRGERRGGPTDRPPSEQRRENRTTSLSLSEVGCCGTDFLTPGAPLLLPSLFSLREASTSCRDLCSGTPQPQGPHHILAFPQTPAPKRSGMPPPGILTNQASRRSSQAPILQRIRADLTPEKSLLTIHSSLAAAASGVFPTKMFS